MLTNPAQQDFPPLPDLQQPWKTARDSASGLLTFLDWALQGASASHDQNETGLSTQDRLLPNLAAVWVMVDGPWCRILTNAIQNLIPLCATRRLQSVRIGSHVGATVTDAILRASKYLASGANEPGFGTAALAELILGKFPKNLDIDPYRLQEVFAWFRGMSPAQEEVNRILRQAAQHPESQTRLLVSRFYDCGFREALSAVPLNRLRTWVKETLSGLDAHCLRRELDLEFSLAPREGSPAVLPTKPRWDGNSRTLYYNGVGIKTYGTNPAPDQIQLLEAFEEAGWPVGSVLNPFFVPGSTKQRDRAKLEQVWTNLNRSLPRGSIRFGGDGTGKNICWHPDSIE